MLPESSGWPLLSKGPIMQLSPYLTLDPSGLYLIHLTHGVWCGYSCPLCNLQLECMKWISRCSSLRLNHSRHWFSKEGEEEAVGRKSIPDEMMHSFIHARVTSAPLCSPRALWWDKIWFRPRSLARRLPPSLVKSLSPSPCSPRPPWVGIDASAHGDRGRSTNRAAVASSNPS